MVTLFNKCKSPKVWRPFPNGAHNDTYCELGYFEAILDFITKVGRDEKFGSTRDSVISSSTTKNSEKDRASL